MTDKIYEIKDKEIPEAEQIITITETKDVVVEVRLMDLEMERDNFIQQRDFMQEEIDRLNTLIGEIKEGIKDIEPVDIIIK